MKKTLLFALALIAVGCAEPEPRNLATLQSLTDADGIENFSLNGKSYSGPVFSLFSDGLLRVSGSLKNGKWHGEREERDYGNTVVAEEQYKDGVLNGWSVYSYPSNSPWAGDAQVTGTWTNGEKCGNWKEVDPHRRVTYRPC